MLCNLQYQFKKDFDAFYKTVQFDWSTSHILRLINKAMPNWNFVRRQLEFDKPMYLFTKTHKPKTKTQMF